MLHFALVSVCVSAFVPVCLSVCMCVCIHMCHSSFPYIHLLLELHALLLSDIFVLMERDVNHDRYVLRTHSQTDIKGNKDEVRMGTLFYP